MNLKLSTIFNNADQTQYIHKACPTTLFVHFNLIKNFDFLSQIKLSVKANKSFEMYEIFLIKFQSIFLFEIEILLCSKNVAKIL
jgi:hypothetical protein